MLRLRTLGGLSIENSASIGGAAANRRPLALLALLAVNGGRGLSRDTIVALLWPESEPERGRNSLSQVISGLRRELGADDLLLGTAELRVNTDVLACDVIEFEQRVAADDLEAATRLYTGPFLDGVFLKNAPEFERWVDQQRSRLQHAQGDALERLATRATARQDHVCAVRLWRQRASLVPTDSRAARELMGALVASGDPAGALAHYRVHQVLLRDDLGVEPVAKLAEFAAVIREGMSRSTDAATTVVRRVSPLVDSGAATGGRARRDEPLRDEPAEIAAVSARVPRRLRWIASAIAVLTLITAALAWRTMESGGPVTPIERLAVLPLVNSTGDTTVNSVAEALTQELISTLLREGVHVVGYYSVAKYRGTSISLDQIGKELKVDAVATWAVRRQGNQLQVSLEVARPQSGEGLWASTRYVVDSLRLPDVAAGAARELATRFATRAPASTRAPSVIASTESPDAKIAYLIGMQGYYRGASGLEFGLRQFQRAIAADSNFAPAWAGLGITYAWAIDYAQLPLADACAKALPAIQRALSLDSELPLGHLARARMLQHCDWNWKEAEAEYRRAIALEPSAIAYQSYGWLLEWYLGRTREGVAMGDTAVAIDPGSALTHLALAWRLRGAGQLDKAEVEAHIASALDPAAVDGYWVLAEVYLRRGDYVTAEREALEVKARYSKPADWNTLGEIYARTGRVSEARDYMRLLMRERPLTGPSRVALARVQMALGEKDAALATLELAVRDRIFIIPYQPYWDPIRHEPRFQALMRAMGLPASETQTRD
jgi:DNA-binding SARP family transcriptional activator/TolB-like protein/Tfp pilus assembly protein PilF